MIHQLARSWTPIEVQQWLRSKNLDAFTTVFSEEGVDGSVLLELRPHDLNRMGVEVCFSCLLLLFMRRVHWSLSVPSLTFAKFVQCDVTSTVIVWLCEMDSHVMNHC
jgi:hypothetical protein